MKAGKRSRAIFALVAAYAVALQGLLLPLPAAAAAPFAVTLCADAAERGSPVLPAHNQATCPCVAGCGTNLLAQSPQFVIASPGVYAGSVGQAPVLTPVIRLPNRSPQVPRAPPAA